MPTVFREKGFRFHFYSNENFEPCHVQFLGTEGRPNFGFPRVRWFGAKGSTPMN